ncbi:MAG: hypothetical protein HW384_716, partial [Dehalococcoidia bacterium]|nr:hypothetical protein [Dehalococcoidia bacterium]
GDKGDTGTHVSIQETSQGANIFNTSPVAKNWESIFPSKPINIQRSSKVIVLVTGVIDFKPSTPSELRLGIGTNVGDPNVWNKYQSANSASDVYIPFSISGTLTLGSGSNNVYFLAKNDTGASTITNATMITIEIQE